MVRVNPLEDRRRACPGAPSRDGRPFLRKEEGGPLRPPFGGSHPRREPRGPGARGWCKTPGAGRSRRAQKGPFWPKTPKKGVLPVFSPFLAKIGKNSHFSEKMAKKQLAS